MVSDGGGEGSCKANYSKEVNRGKSKYKVVSKLKKKKKKKGGGGSAPKRDRGDLL